MIYVDELKSRGWKLRSHATKSSHLFTDENMEELHEFAEKIGMKRKWFQDHRLIPHYDITPARRMLAIKNGAIEVKTKDALRKLGNNT